MTVKKLYTIIAVALMAGYIWLFYVLLYKPAASKTIICPFRAVTGFPCPSCGNTRSVLQLIAGNLKEALYINPLGLLVAVAMLVLPAWLVYDILLQKDSLYKNYVSFEKKLKNKSIVAVLLILLLINWLWSIQKML